MVLILIKLKKLIFSSINNIPNKMSTPKTRSQVANMRLRNASAVNLYPSQLEKYMNLYKRSFDGSESIHAWATRHSNRFYLTVNTDIPLRVIHRDMAEQLKDIPICKLTRLTVTRYILENNVGDDYTEGKKALNSFLHKEYDTWFSSFDTEAHEDPDASSPTAESRWAYYCAKKLSKRLGFKVEHLAAVVEAWLDSYKAA